MDFDLRRRMLDYYNARAPEYEEAYTLGTGTASIPDPEVFRTEATSLSGIVRTFAHGHLIDLAWSTERARLNAKVERQQRRLNDGTEFEIYKRYCDRADIAEWAAKYDATVHVEHFGTAFYAVSGRFNVQTGS